MKFISKTNIKNKIFFILPTLLLLVIALSGCINAPQNSNSPHWFEIMRITVNDSPSLNRVLNLTLTAKTTQIGGIEPNSSLEIILPEGFILLRGNLTQRINLGQNDTANLSIIIKANQTGIWIITADALTPRGNYYEHTSIYLFVEESNGSISYEPPPPCSGNIFEVTECMKTEAVRG